MKKQWYRSPSFIILMIYGGVLLTAIAIDRRTPPPPGFEPPAQKTAPLPVSTTKGDPSVMNLPLDVLTQRLAQKLESNPEDIPGWILLGRSYATLGDYEKSKQAFLTAMDRAPKNAELHVRYGETLMAQAKERVTPEAKQLFLAAVKIDPAHPGARHYLALADYQEGNIHQAYEAWLTLSREAPQNAPWIPKVQTYLDRAASQLGIKAKS